MTLDNYLNTNASPTPSKWREEAEFRRANVSWLRYSQQIAVLVIENMRRQKLTQATLAERMNCTQQYVSKILKGSENLSLEIISKLENALGISLINITLQYPTVDIAGEESETYH